MYIKRILSVKSVTTSAFLFGCRQTGKTSLLKNTLNPDIYIDLLKKSELIRYTKNPELLYDEIKAIEKNKPLVIIDEIQKIPDLLNEIHRLIESPLKPQFILTGSSARKLKKNQSNLLGGRAITLKLFPFAYREIKNLFSLKNYLHFGGLPNIVLTESLEIKKSMLESYVTTYLKEEIYNEALTRNLPAFTKFLELAAFENGNIINYSNLAGETGVSLNLIKEYFNILEDTLLGFYIQPFYKSHRKRIVNHPRFYFIDTGMIFALKKMLSIELIKGTSIYGNAFEHFIILETLKGIHYTGQEINLYFFRTFDGAEVDLILERYGKIIAVEIKASENPRNLSGMKSFLKDHTVEKALCVCLTPRKFIHGNISFIHWKDYIEKLYKKKLFSRKQSRKRT